MRIIDRTEMQLKDYGNDRLLALLFAKRCYCSLTGCSQAEQAREALDAALLHAHRSEDKQVHLRVYYEAVRLCQLQGLDSEVEQYQSKLMTLCSCSNTPPLSKADCHKLLGHSLLFRADRRAIAHYEKALEIHKAEVGAKHPCTAKVLAAMGPAYRDTYDYGSEGASMLKVMKAALEIEQASGNSFDLPWFHQTIGHMYTLLPRLAGAGSCSDERFLSWRQSAREHISKAKMLFETSAKEQCGTTHFAGSLRIEAEYILAFEPGRIEEVFPLCAEALRLYGHCLGKSSKSPYVARVHVVEGWACLQKQNMAKQAIICFGKALTILHSEASVRVADIHYWLGHSHALLQNLETAEHHFKASLHLLGELPSDHSQVFWQQACQSELDEVEALHRGLLKIKSRLMTTSRFLLFTKILICQVLGLKRAVLLFVVFPILLIGLHYILPFFESMLLCSVVLVTRHPRKFVEVCKLLLYLPLMLRSTEGTRSLTFVEVSPGDTEIGFKEMCNYVDLEGHLRTHGAVLFRGWFSSPSGPAFQQATDILMGRLRLTEHMFEGGYNPRILVQGTRCIFSPKSPLVCEEEAVSSISEGLAESVGCIWDSSYWRKYVDSHHTEMAYSADKPDLFALYSQKVPKVGGGIMLSDECHVLECLKRHPLGRAVLSHVELDNFVLHDFLPEDGPLVSGIISAKQYFAASPLHKRHGDVSEQDRDAFLARCWGDTPEQRSAIIEKNGYELQSIVPVAAGHASSQLGWMSDWVQASFGLVVLLLVWQFVDSPRLALLLPMCLLLRSLVNGQTGKTFMEANTKRTRLVSNAIKIERTLQGSTDRRALGFFAPFYGAVYKDTQQEPSTMDKTIVAIAHWLASSHIAIQLGDIVLVDNNRVAHTRGLPFVGTRVVYSAQFRRQR
ncbi:unnamed protein product [Symbiodinium sp. CCMP2456]|nr:unnamed protein product [Symbiodinium sp. CCMP2456]